MLAPEVKPSLRLVSLPGEIPGPLFAAHARLDRTHSTEIAHGSSPVGEPLRAVVIDSDPACRARVRDVLGRVEGIHLVHEAARIEEGVHEVLTEHPALVIIGLDEPRAALALTAKLLEILPATMIVISADATSPDLVKEAMRVGAREYLTRPPDPEEIEASVRRLMRQRAQATGTRRTPGSVIAIFAAKGGLGTTFVATNLAILLAESGERHAAIVDLNPDLGDVDTFLNLKATHSLQALAGQDATPGTGDILETALDLHRSGLRMLAQPTDRVEEPIAPGEIGRVLTRLKTSFEFVVVDVARRFDELTLEALDLADLILLLTALDLPTIRNTRRSIEIFTRLGHVKKLRLVLNRHRPAQAAARLEQAFGLPVFWHLPEDAATAVAAVNAGVPATAVGPETELATSLRGLAAALAAPEAPAVVVPDARSGLLRRLILGNT